MAKHSLYQIPGSERELVRKSIYYGLSDAFTLDDARKAFIENKYTHVADIEADTLKQCKIIINDQRSTSDRYVRLKALRDINLGDIIYNHKTRIYYVVAPDKFDRIKMK